MTPPLPPIMGEAEGLCLILPADSLDFEGRTPCKIPGIIPPGMDCYKLKWHIILYSDVKANKPTVYKISGTPWRKQNERTGNWRIITGKEGRIIYQLKNEKGEALLYLLKLDENILIYTKEQRDGLR